MLRNSLIAVFASLLGVQSVLGTSGYYRAPAKGLVADSVADQDVKVEARDLGSNPLSPVAGVIGLLMSLHYEYWCTEFLPNFPTPSKYIETTVTRTETETVSGESTITEGSGVSVTSGVGSVMETTTITVTVEEKSTTTTTTKITPPSIAHRDVEVPEFLNGYDKKIIRSACSVVLQPSPRATTTTAIVSVTSNLCTRTTLYTTTIIPSQTTTIRTTSTTVIKVPKIETITVTENADSQYGI